MISVVIATYGNAEWEELAWGRAYPSVQDADEIIVHHEPDGTRATSLNNAVAKAQHEWLLMLDADDELAPGFIGAMRRGVERHGADGARVLLTPAVSYIRKGRPAPAKFNDRGISLAQDNWLVIGTLLRRDLFMEAEGIPEYPHGFEDWALWNKCWQLGAMVVKVKDAVYRAHVNPLSKHRQGWKDREWQVATHMRVAAELAEWGKAHAC